MEVTNHLLTGMILQVRHASVVPGCSRVPGLNVPLEPRKEKDEKKDTEEKEKKARHGLKQKGVGNLESTGRIIPGRT